MDTSTANSAAGPSSELKTLWVGDVDQYMDEAYIHSLFAHTGEVVNVKIIRDKQTLLPAGYGFVEFTSHYAAQKALEAYNGQPIPGTNRTYRLNWAIFGLSDKRPAGISKTDGDGDHAVFVGDLAAEVTDEMLLNSFAQRYSSVRNAKVVFDPQSGGSRGYGFVRFGDENESQRAMSEMQGVFIGSRRIRLNSATPKKLMQQQQQQMQQQQYSQQQSQKVIKSAPPTTYVRPRVTGPITPTIYAPYVYPYTYPYGVDYSQYLYSYAAAAAAATPTPTVTTPTQPSIIIPKEDEIDFTKPFNVEENNNYYVDKHVELFLNNHEFFINNAYAFESAAVGGVYSEQQHQVSYS